MLNFSLKKIDDLLIENDEASNCVEWIIKDDVEPVVLSTVRTDVLEVVNESLNALNHSTHGVEAVRHESNIINANVDT